MEQHDPSRRQYAPPTYTTQQPQQGGAPAQGQYATPGATERFRQSSYLQESPSSGRASGDAQQVYGFAQGAQYGAGTGLQPSPIQYGQEMQTPETQRQQAQQYQQYGSNVVYGMAQPQTAQSPYESVPQFRSRTSGASETLGTQFGVPQATQYYLAGQPGPTSASAPELPTPQIPSQYQQQPETYPQPSASSTHPYPNPLMDPSQAGAYAAYVQQPQYQAQQQAPPIDQNFDRYQAQIRTVFTLARDGALRDVGPQLRDVSQYLLGHAEMLGLTRDDSALRDDRLRLWDEFNRAWLVVLQRQFDMTQEMLQTGQPLREPQSIMNAQVLERLSQDLIRLCDNIEKHGLVDYQMGVAEEDIMDLMLRCLSLLNPMSQRSGEGEAPAESSTAGASRGR